MEVTKQNLNTTLWVKPGVIEKTRKWHVVDAAGMTLGRLAVEITKKLIGKHKGFFCDFWDSGDYVVVTNAAKITVTGNKMKEKMYYKHSGYKGHLKETPLWMLMQKHPEDALMFAIKGMLPKNKQRAVRLKRLKIFKDAEHSYKHLSLEPLAING